MSMAEAEMAEESKRERFTRLAEGRVRAIEDHVRRLGNLSNTSLYDYDEASAESYIDRVKVAVERVEDDFQRRLERKHRKETMRSPVAMAELNGDRLRSLRLEANATQQEVADLVNVSQPRVSLWERDVMSIPPELHQAVLEAMDELKRRS